MTRQEKIEINYVIENHLNDDETIKADYIKAFGSLRGFAKFLADECDLFWTGGYDVYVDDDEDITPFQPEFVEIDDRVIRLGDLVGMIHDDLYDEYLSRKA